MNMSRLVGQTVLLGALCSGAALHAYELPESAGRWTGAWTVPGLPVPARPAADPVDQVPAWSGDWPAGVDLYPPRPDGRDDEVHCMALSCGQGPAPEIITIPDCRRGPC